MKNAMIEHLQNLQNKGQMVTVLHYQNGKIENFTPFANENYMSKGLLNALSNGITLTKDQQQELDTYKFEMVLQ